MTMLKLFPAAAVLAGVTACAVQRPVTRGPAPQARGQSASVHTLGIPPGQLPSAGRCRVWIPGVPPGRQARQRSCAGIAETAPAGSWIVYRPGRDRSVVHVRVVHETRPGVVVLIRFFAVGSGEFLREESPERYREEEDSEPERGRGRRP